MHRKGVLVPSTLFTDTCSLVFFSKDSSTRIQSLILALVGIEGLRVLAVWDSSFTRDQLGDYDDADLGFGACG